MSPYGKLPKTCRAQVLVISLYPFTGGIVKSASHKVACQASEIIVRVRIMSNPTIVHQLRQLKGSLRQPQHGQDLYVLEQAIRGMGLTHPYRLIVNSKVNQLTSLLSVPTFSKGGIGTLATSSSEFLYHLTGVRKVLKYSGWNYFPRGFPTLRHSDRRIFSYLLNDYNRNNRGPLPLGRYAKGTLSGFRGFTWWTSLKILEAHVVCSAHRLGMPNKWIPKFALVMRCPSTYIAGGHFASVPTTLDGFISEIFCPADYRSAQTLPSYGRAINLDNLGRLAAGPEEFAVGSIDVREVEFFPVLIDRAVRSVHVVQRDARLWQLLEIFYNGL
jgi:hypothetical protein